MSISDLDAAVSAVMSSLSLFSLLDGDPDLADGIDAVELPQARQLLLVPQQRIAAGKFDPVGLLRRAEGEPPFAALLLEGMLTCTRRVAGGRGIALFGPGEVLDPWSREPGMVPAQVSWSAVTSTRVALLGVRFLTAVQRWPVLALRLFERLADQNRRLSLQATVASLSRAEERILATLWHLAGKYGRVGPKGIILPIALTHDAIGELVGTRRSAVSGAMKRLLSVGAITRRTDGIYVLCEGSQQLLAVAAASVSEDRSATIRVVEPVRRSVQRAGLDWGSLDTRALGRLRAEVSLLRESETQLRSFFELAGIGIALLDAGSGQIRRVNARLSRMTGYSRPELVGRELSALLAPEDRPAWRASVAALCSGDRSSRQNELDVRLVCEDGTTTPATSNITILAADELGPSELIAVFQDITQRVEAEDALRRSEHTLRIACEAAKIGEWILELDTLKVTPSTRFAQLLGLSMGAAERLSTIMRMVHPDDVQSISNAIDHSADQRTGLSSEVRLRADADDEPRWLEVTGEFVTDPDGRPLLTGVSRDITDRKRAEAALAEREELLRRAADAGGADLWTWSPSLNRVSTDMSVFGRRGSEVMSLEQAVGSAIHADDRRHYIAALHAATKSDTPFVFDSRLSTVDTSARWVRTRGRTIDREGRPLVVGISYDITIEKETETQLREAEALLTVVQDAGLAFSIVELDPHDLASDEDATDSASGTKTLRGWLTRVFPPDRQRINLAIQSMKEGGPSMDETYRIQQLNGRVQTVRTRGRLVLHPHTQVKRAVLLDQICDV